MAKRAERTSLNKLPPEFYQRNTLRVAEELMGCLLVRATEQGMIIGRINEGEAYLGVSDKASHAYGERRTKRTEPLYEAGGIAYIHLIYGMYHCFNVVTEHAGIPQSVLLRGLEIVEGHDLAAINRFGSPYEKLSEAQRRGLVDGPGKLCRALSIDSSLNGESMQGDALFICDEINGHCRSSTGVERSKRIGIDYAEEARDLPYRFTLG